MIELELLKMRQFSTIPKFGSAKTIIKLRFTAFVDNAQVCKTLHLVDTSVVLYKRDKISKDYTEKTIEINTKKQ